MSRNRGKAGQQQQRPAAKKTVAKKTADKPPASKSDLEPTEAELAEAAALKDAQSSPEATQAAIDARTQEAAPRTAPKTGTWYGLATAPKDGAAMVTEEPYSTADMAREGAGTTLPGAPDVTNVVAVEAADRDEALGIYEALEDRSAQTEVAKARPAGARASLFETRTQQVDHQELLVSPTGIAHVASDCRFTRGKTDLTKVPDEDGEILGYLMSKGGATYTGDEDDAKPVKMSGYCVYCAVRAPEVTPEPAAVSA